MKNIKMKKILSIVLMLTLVLTMIFSVATPTMATADLPLGAVNRTEEVTTGINPGIYIVNDSYNNDPYTGHRLIAPDYSWDSETMENYVFDPTNFPDIQWHPDGFPLRATYRHRHILRSLI